MKHIAQIAVVWLEDYPVNLSLHSRSRGRKDNWDVESCMSNNLAFRHEQALNRCIGDYDPRSEFAFERLYRHLPADKICVLPPWHP